jgi:tetratricopeptide (TPR) repeat protein
MRLNKLFLFLTVIGFLCASALRAREAHEHQHDSSEKLGRVNFPVSCSAAAQKRFNRGIALLHSFWYEEAEKVFTEVTVIDPNCTMGYWGVAMSNYHPVWAPPTPAELEKGSAAVEKAKSIGAKTERERAYIDAIELFYKDSDKLDHRTRALAFEKAMGQVHMRHPEDREAAIFYALSLLGTALPTDKSYANQKKAAEILNQVLPEEPEHPGVAHYIIHSFDYPQLAYLALPAARTYAEIASSSPHALHMPSHIFTRLGLWEESIQSNHDSAAAAKGWVAKAHPGAASFDQLHAMDYLAYAYLQGAQDQKAKGVVDEASTVTKVDTENFAAAYALAAIPARYALERRNWSEAAALKVHPANFPWDRFPYTEAITYFSRAIGAAKTGNVSAARKDVEKLASLHNALVEAKNDYWATQVEIQRQGAAAWLALAEGKNEGALKLMRAAADLEDSTEKHPVTPGPLIPARELLGEMLLELNQPEQALKEFEASQQVEPNRFRGIYGAAHAAELTGDPEKARTYYAKLISLCEGADTVRPELKQAKTFMAKK